VEEYPSSETIRFLIVIKEACYLNFTAFIGKLPVRTVEIFNEVGEKNTEDHKTGK